MLPLQAGGLLSCSTLISIKKQVSMPVWNFSLAWFLACIVGGLLWIKEYTYIMNLYGIIF